MEVTAGGSSDGGRPRRSTAVPSCYHRPSAGSCHHVCKYGSAHTFDDQDRDQPRRAAQSKPRKQPPSPSPAPAPATAVVLGKLRSASSRRRVGDLLITKPDKVSKKPVAPAAVGDDDSVVWKDIMAYDSPEKIAVVGEAKKKDGSVIKGKKSVKSSHGKAKIVAEETTGGDNEIAANKKPHGSAKKKNHLIKSKLQAADTTTSPSDISDKSKNTKVIKSSSRTKNVKPPKPKKNLPQIGQQITQQNSPSPSPSPSPSSSDIKEEQKPPKPLAEEAKSGKPAPAPPPPAHRRAKSMSITGTKSVRFPFTRHASKSSTTFKVIRSKSSRTTLSPPESTPAPATRLKFFRRGDAGSNSSNNGSGIQLKIRSLRRRGSSRSGGTAATGFSVPAVVLRHQKTLEKKRSRRLYNSVIEETAGKLVKARKSRVKALVGAFESLISKIGK